MPEPAPEPAQEPAGVPAAAAAAPPRRPLARRAGRLALLSAGGLVLLLVALSLLARVAPPVSTLMLRDLAFLRGYDRAWIDLDAAAPVLLASVVASEDQTFCSHGGVEWDALHAQWQRWRAGERARGASTVSMQVARNLFLWQGPSPVRKAIEVPLAVWLDAVLGKRRMMEVYINVAELGPRVYGFEAAAQRAFGVSAADVSPRQAALLVATLPAPAARDAADPTGRQAAVAQTIERRARAVGALDDCLAPPPPSVPPPAPRPADLR